MPQEIADSQSAVGMKTGRCSSSRFEAASGLIKNDAGLGEQERHLKTLAYQFKVWLISSI